MRVTVLQQQTKALQAEQAAGSDGVSKQIDSIKQLLWHGNVAGALDRLASLFQDLDLMRKRSAPAEKLAGRNRGVRDLHSQQSRIHPELRRAVSAGGNDQHGVRRIDD
jgi:hypothetical protein